MRAKINRKPNTINSLLNKLGKLLNSLIRGIKRADTSISRMRYTL